LGHGAPKKVGRPHKGRCHPKRRLGGQKGDREVQYQKIMEMVEGTERPEIENVETKNVRKRVGEKTAGKAKSASESGVRGKGAYEKKELCKNGQMQKKKSLVKN